MAISSLGLSDFWRERTLVEERRDGAERFDLATVGVARQLVERVHENGRERVVVFRLDFFAVVAAVTAVRGGDVHHSLDGVVVELLDEQASLDADHFGVRLQVLWVVEPVVILAHRHGVVVVCLIMEHRKLFTEYRKNVRATAPAAPPRTRTNHGFGSDIANATITPPRPATTPTYRTRRMQMSRQ